MSDSETERSSDAGSEYDETYGSDTDDAASVASDDSTAQQEKAALKIQALQRGRLARRQVEKKKRAKKKNRAEELSDVSAMPSAESATAEEQAAALAIQTQYRGLAARKQVRARANGLDYANSKCSSASFYSLPFYTF
eukprot:TRINITY_DN274_c0_g1_i5.p2 TRINITY_DN274_c0_g1~~TRINITY_DN274_c0_g1_i5.p2  ORF type:complete len:138 (+),score=41.95 TRINITY_DN274_c0_g1_i5:175-588(+)